MERLWLRGGFLNSYLAKSEARSVQRRIDFKKTYLERVNSPTYTLFDIFPTTFFTLFNRKYDYLNVEARRAEIQTQV